MRTYFEDVVDAIVEMSAGALKQLHPSTEEERALWTTPDELTFFSIGEGQHSPRLQLAFGEYRAGHHHVCSIADYVGKKKLARYRTARRQFAQVNKEDLALWEEAEVPLSDMRAFYRAFTAFASECAFAFAARAMPAALQGASFRVHPDCIFLAFDDVECATLPALLPRSPFEPRHADMLGLVAQSCVQDEASARLLATLAATGDVLHTGQAMELLGASSDEVTRAAAQQRERFAKARAKELDAKSWPEALQRTFKTLLLQGRLMR